MWKIYFPRFIIFLVPTPLHTINAEILACRNFGDSVGNPVELNIGEFLNWHLWYMDGNYIRSHNINIGSFIIRRFGAQSPNRQIQCTVSPIFLQLRYILECLIFFQDNEKWTPFKTFRVSDRHSAN